MHIYVREQFAELLHAEKEVCALFVWHAEVMPRVRQTAVGVFAIMFIFATLEFPRGARELQLTGVVLWFCGFGAIFCFGGRVRDDAGTMGQ